MDFVVQNDKELSSDFNLPIFSDKEIKTLNNLSDTQTPLDLAINELSKDSTTLGCTKSETREYEVNCTTDCPMQKKSKTTQISQMICL